MVYNVVEIVHRRIQSHSLFIKVSVSFQHMPFTECRCSLFFGIQRLKTFRSYDAVDSYKLILSILVSFFARLLRKGYKKTLEFEDLSDMLEKDKCRVVYPLFQSSWEKGRQNTGVSRYE